MELKPLYYQNYILLTLFDLRYAKTDDEKIVACALLQTLVNKFSYYLGFKDETQFTYTSNYNFYDALHDIDLAVKSLLYTSTTWLMNEKTFFDTLVVWDNLKRITRTLASMVGGLQADDKEYSQLLAKISIKDLDNEEVLKEIRKKIQNMGKEDVPEKQKYLKKILKDSKLKKKKIFSLIIPKDGNIRKMQKESTIKKLLKQLDGIKSKRKKKDIKNG